MIVNRTVFETQDLTSEINLAEGDIIIERLDDGMVKYYFVDSVISEREYKVVNEFDKNENKIIEVGNGNYQCFVFNEQLRVVLNMPLNKK